MDPQMPSSVAAEPDDLSETAPHSHVSDRQATQQAREQVVGQRPGTLVVHPDALAPRLFMISYDTDEFVEREYDNYDELLAFFSGTRSCATGLTCAATTTWASWSA
ncbi:hypothetical protein LRS06_01205 [Hymenobacter sp. J193]|uniref:hypothetical protein n=1 Tax=Hymenobacter sp. J193 TaxID=2898429 RepID=UPI002151FE29|nr:hypothetical protein [Hymenobacter sp. J193]MCR5886411.1 hypothetical protein [Hymenobacter sp. J193]